MNIHPKQKQQSSQQTKKRAQILALSIIAAFALLIALFIVFDVFKIISWRITPHTDPQPGTLSAKLNASENLSDIPEDEIRFRINKNVNIENIYKKGDIMLENPVACKYDIEFKFYRRDNSELIYTSKMLKPGEFISRDKLSVRLPVGTYDCIFVARAYQSGTFFGETTGGMKINIIDNG